MKARKIDSLGRIVLPIDIRNALGLETGDALSITLDNGKVVLEKAS